MTSTALAYAAFALLALVGPGLALQRLARVRVDPALVVPLGLAACAAAYWLGLVLALPWLGPLLLAALDLALLAGRRGLRRAEGPALAGAVLPCAALVAALAVAEYGQNRIGPRGEFLFDNVVPEDTAFHAGLAWELSVGYPPQVPGLSGVPMGYHVGLPLVRAAALRWAGVRPLDQLSRLENTLIACAMVLALRALVVRLAAGPLALALCGFTLLATDFSWLFAGRTELWLNVTDANLLFSLAHANSSVAALAIALGLLVALSRHDAGEGRGWYALALVLAAALPHFKAFVAAQALFGLALAALLTRRWREPAPLLALGLLGLGAVVLGRASTHMEVLLDPLTIVAKMRQSLGLAPSAHGAQLLAFTLLWLLASLGLRLVGLPAALGALASRRLESVAFAAMALCGWPIGMLFRVTPVEFPGRAPYNEAWYFVEQSGPLLWVFACLALERLVPAGRSARLAVAAAAALSLPSTLQFLALKHATPPAVAPPAVVEAMAALESASRPGDVVLQRPEPKRFPPPPLVLIGRRVPYTRFIPYLYQVAPPVELRARIEDVRRFFKTSDPAEALAVARGLGARFVVLYGDDAVLFPAAGLLQPLYERENARVYRILGVD